MKILNHATWLLLLAFLPTMPCACSDVEHAQQKWAIKHLSAAASARYAALHPGMTRAELDKRFREDGGEQTFPSGVRYVLQLGNRDGAAVVFEVDYRPQLMDAATYADPARRLDWLQQRVKDATIEPGPNDVIVSIGAPYWRPLYHE